MQGQFYLELLKIIIDYKGKLIFDKSKPNGVSKKLLDINLIKSLGWRPKVDLKNGLINISKDAPSWLVGYGTPNTNPLGGFYGISLLIISCIFYFLKFDKKLRQ